LFQKDMLAPATCC